MPEVPTETEKPSPFTFDVWQCPACNWAMSDTAYTALRVNVKCPNCNAWDVSGFRLRKARKDLVNFESEQIKK